MPNLVKFNEIVDWDENGAIEYSPVYVDIDKIQYIGPHADGNPKHCTITLNDSWTVGLNVDMDHLASMVNKVFSYTTAAYTSEQLPEIENAIRAQERCIRLERQVDNGRC